MDAFADLKPDRIWKYFAEILTIPRPSKHEEKIIAFLVDFAENHRLKWQKDEAGNVLIRKPASAGYERREILVLQSHMDMVCEHDSDVPFDFQKDPIQAYPEKGWIKARGTTLGADNGIGMAAQLAILSDPSVKHGELECLFTVDEESGMTGAFNLDAGFFQGKYLINLDSEDEGELFIGCAGGMDTLISCPIDKKAHIASDYSAVQIKIGGLRGGHSGDDIHKGRGNANKILARLLWNAVRNFPIRISHLEGGNLRNAIPREALAIVLVQSSERDKFNEFLSNFAHAVFEELQPVEDAFSIAFDACELPPDYITDESIKPLISALHACPNGVVAMSRTIPDLVETSTNMASLRTEGKNWIDIVTSQRSSVDSSKKNIASRIRSQFELVGARIEHKGNYPGWKPNRDSKLVSITREQYRSLFHAEPVVRAIHAGLECGLFLDKYPYLDMVSFGPTIKDAHSPAERMEIETVRKFWDLLLAVMQNIPER